MLYSCDILEQISSENKEKIKVITYVIALMVRDNIPSNTITRTKLIDIYKLCKNKQIEYENTNKEISDFISYYYKSVINLTISRSGNSVLSLYIFAKNRGLESLTF